MLFKGGLQIKIIYRRKRDIVDPSIIEDFKTHFNNTLLPTQLKYGARLVGSWRGKEIDGVVEIFAVWEYDSYDDYERIESKVKGDIEHVERVKNWYEKMGGRENLKKSFFKIDQDFLENTVSRDKTIFS